MLKMSLLSMLLSTFFAIDTVPANAQRNLPDNRWTIKVQTQKQDRAFQYRGSQLNPVAKSEITIKRLTEKGEPHPFEVIWCHDGKPLGMERKGPYLINVGHITDVEVTQRGYSEEENKATAYVLFRLALAAYHHVNPIVTMNVPDQSLDQIAQEIRNRGAEDFTLDADQGYPPGVLFNLETDGGKKYRLVYRTPAK